MDWEDERYVRFYCRDTAEFLILSWRARGLFGLLLRKADRAGIIELGRVGAEGLGAILHAPYDEISEPFEELVADGCVQLSKSREKVQLIIPNYLEAQEAKLSDKARARESRGRRRDKARAGIAQEQETNGVLYFVQSTRGGAIKIGFAIDLAARISNLQTGNPEGLKVLLAYDGTSEDEEQLHARFNSLRTRGEWFKPETELLVFITDMTARIKAGKLSASRAVTFLRKLQRSVTGRDKTVHGASRAVTGPDSEQSQIPLPSLAVTDQSEGEPEEAERSGRDKTVTRGHSVPSRTVLYDEAPSFDRSSKTSGDGAVGAPAPGTERTTDLRISVMAWEPSEAKRADLLATGGVTDEDINEGLVDFRNVDPATTALPEWFEQRFGRFVATARNRRMSRQGARDARDGSAGGSARAPQGDARPMAQATAGDFNHPRDRLMDARSRI